MDNLFFKIPALNYIFGVHFANDVEFPVIVPKNINVYDCGSRDDEGDLYVHYYILGHQWGGCGRGIPPPRTRTFRQFGC